MKDQANKKNKKKVLLYYLILAACLLVIAAVTVTVIFAVRGSNADLSIDADQELPDEGNEEPDDEDDNPTVVDTSYCNPMLTLTVANVFDLHQNRTLGWFYRHEGLDFAGEEGDEVFAIQDGVVSDLTYESDPNSAIFYSGSITIDHGNGITSTYKFINLEDGIARGDQIKRGQLIGTLSKATGTEAYVGAHLHLEIKDSGKLIDPATILDIIDK